MKRSKELKKLLEKCEKQDCRVLDPGEGKPYKVLCACGDHLEWVHKTPSGSRYVANKLSVFRGWSCWDREAE
jgi:hypothetical protein